MESTEITASTSAAAGRRRELEQQAHVLQTAAQAFELAAAIIRWRHYCECSWCGGKIETFEQPPHPYIETEANLIRQIAFSMCGVLGKVNHNVDSQRLLQALDKADRDFRECFHSEKRLRLVEQYDEIDWELQTRIAPRQFWLPDSPFVRLAYKQFLSAARGFASSRGVSVQVCFELGWIALTEQYPFLGDDIEALNDISQAAAFQQYVAPAVRALLIQFKAFEYDLRLDKFDIGYEIWRQTKTRWAYESWAQKRLAKMAKTLPDLLRSAAAQLREQAVRVDEELAKASCLPSWRSDNHVLSYCGAQLQYKRPAGRQRAVLDCFHMHQWIDTVPNPFSDREGKPVKANLKNAVDDLNKKCKGAGVLLKFFIKGANGDFVGWRDTSRNEQLGEIGFEGAKRPLETRSDEVRQHVHGQQRRSACNH